MRFMRLRLVPRTRSSHGRAARVFANFEFKSGTRNHNVASVPLIPKFASRLPRARATFGIGTLVGRLAPQGQAASSCHDGGRWLRWAKRKGNPITLSAPGVDGFATGQPILPCGAAIGSLGGAGGAKVASLREQDIEHGVAGLVGSRTRAPRCGRSNQSPFRSKTLDS